MNRIFPDTYPLGVTYYVSANGAGSGLSEADPMPLQDAINLNYGPGDSVLLCRGDTFYGTLNLNVKSTPDSPFVLGAYGIGKKPVISRAKFINTAWIRHNNAFFCFDLTAIGTFDGVQDDGSNVGFIEDISGKKWGIRRENADACTDLYDFYCADGCLYVKSDIDPFQALGRLTLCNYHVWDSLVKVSSNMEVRDLHLENGGYGITLSSTGRRNIYIHDCVIQNIGGTRLGETGWVKAGNAIEFYGSAFHALIEHNLIRDTYDVGFTLQGGGECRWSDVTVRQNIFAYNTQACEVWTSGTDADQGIDGLHFIENICINQGEGWGTIARPDKFGSLGQVITTNILVYDYLSPILNITILGNIFYNRSDNNRAYSISSFGGTFLKKVKTDCNNIYLPKETTICCSTDDTTDTLYGSRYLNFAHWQMVYEQDLNSTFTAIGNNLHQFSAMEEVARVSYDFLEILNSVKAAGIPVAF
jgi:hypothetical protein